MPAYRKSNPNLTVITRDNFIVCPLVYCLLLPAVMSSYAFAPLRYQLPRSPQNPPHLRQKTSKMFRGSFRHLLARLHSLTCYAQQSVVLFDLRAKLLEADRSFQAYTNSSSQVS